MLLLQARSLTKVYDKRAVVDGVDFDIHSGEIVGLLGQNGAGKTTAFRMAIGMIRPNAGRVFFQGEDVTDLPMYLRSRRGMGYLSQDPSIFQRLTVEQNILAVLETLRGARKDRRRIAAKLLDDLGLGKLAHSKAYTLSGGERRRLEISRALATSPTLILLDEPFSGVDPIAVTEIQNIIMRLRDKGIGILLTDHNVRDTLEVTHHAYIIAEGKIVTAGTSKEIIEDPAARQAYLGDKFDDMRHRSHRPVPTRRAQSGDAGSASDS